MNFGRKLGKSKTASAPDSGFFAQHRRALLVTAGVLVVAGVVAGAALVGKNSPIHDTVQAVTGDVALRLARTTGFTVGEILVVGREATPREALLHALNVDFGDPILGVDITAARERMLALPWVSSVAVERVLPATLVVTLVERRPMAVWQHNKQYAVIDREGRVLDRDTVSTYPELLVVSGEDAPVHAAALIDMLRSEPQLMDRVNAAMRVGGRRWNVFLDNGISVRLPEDEPAEAWHRLAEYQRLHALLAKNIRAIDMRIPDKLIVQARPPQEASSDAPAAPEGASAGGDARKIAPTATAPTQLNRGQPTAPGKTNPIRTAPGKASPGNTSPGKGATDKAPQGKITRRDGRPLANGRNV